MMPTTILMRVLAADLGEGFLCSDTLDEMIAVFRLFSLIFFFKLALAVLTHLSMLCNMRWWAAHIDIIYLNFYQWNRNTYFQFICRIWTFFDAKQHVWHCKLIWTLGSVVPNCRFALIGGGDSFLFNRHFFYIFCYIFNSIAKRHDISLLYINKTGQG